MTASGRASTAELTLPTIPQAGVPGAALVSGAVKITIAMISLLALGGMLCAALITVTLTLDGPGELEPLRLSTVRSIETAIVSDVAVLTGERVAAGQLLLRFDNQFLSARLDQLRLEARQRSMELNQAIASQPVRRQQEMERLHRSEADVIRTRAMLRDRMVAFGLGSAVDSFLAAYRPGSHVAMDVAVGELRSAEAAQREARLGAALVDQASMDIERRRAAADQVSAAIADAERQSFSLELRAPVAGIVFGDRLETLIGSVALPGETLLEIADPTRWRATIWLSERAVHEIRKGDPAVIEIPALRTRGIESLAGTVDGIAPEPDLSGDSPGRALYRTTIRLDVDALSQADLQLLRKGYTIRGRVVTRRVRLGTMLRDQVLGGTEMRSTSRQTVQ